MSARDVPEWAGAVLVQAGAQRDLVVLDHHDCGYAQACGHGQPLVARGGTRRAVARPREADARLAPVPESERGACGDGHAGTHVTDRLDYPSGDVAVVEVPATTGAVRCRQIAGETVMQRQPHHVAGARVANHRDDHVAVPVQRSHAADRDRFLAHAEPCLADHALTDPALESDILQPGDEQVAVQGEERGCSQFSNHAGAFGITFDAATEVVHETGIRGPVPVFRRVESGVSLQGCPWWNGGIDPARKLDDSLAARQTSPVCHRHALRRDSNEMPQ